MAGCCFFVLMVLLTFLLWGTWLNNIATAYQGGCGQIRYLKFIQPEKGHYLEGHVFLNLSIGARRSCEEECLYQRECVAINVGPRIQDMVVCELSNSDHFQHRKDLKPRQDWTYRGTENVCSAKPCFNNGKCFLGYTGKGYLCDCQAGYTGENCGKDIDECSSDCHNCHEDAKCINIPGSFNCSCKPGYIGDGRVCSDIDECSNDCHNCHEDATCINIPGSFNCICKPGYIGNGRECADPVAFYPLNSAYGTKEINNRVAQGVPSGVTLAPGPDGAADGSYEFFGTWNSYIEFPNSAGGPLDVRYSMTMLCWVYHNGQDGPLFNYKTSGAWGVHMWAVSGPQLFVRFPRRDYYFTSPLNASLEGGWKFVGASYDRGSGEAKVWVNGTAVQTLNIGASLELATQDPIRMGAKSDDERYFKGRIAQMQVYNEALSQEQIQALGASVSRK